MIFTFVLNVTVDVAICGVNAAWQPSKGGAINRVILAGYGTADVLLPIGTVATVMVRNGPPEPAVGLLSSAIARIDNKSIVALRCKCAGVFERNLPPRGSPYTTFRRTYRPYSNRLRPRTGNTRRHIRKGRWFAFVIINAREILTNKIIYELVQFHKLLHEIQNLSHNGVNFYWFIQVGPKWTKGF